MKEQRFIWLSLGLGTFIGCAVLSPLEDIEPAGPDTAAAGGGGARDGGGSGGGDAGPDAATAACTTHAECGERFADQESRCRSSDGTCVRLKTQACPGVYGDWRDPNAVYFGALAPLVNQSLDGSQPVRNYRMAHEELNGDSIGGLPPAEAGGARRPLVMIVCNNHSALIEDALTHLVEEVQVPGVIAHLLPGDLLDAFEAHGLPNDTFFLSPVGAVDALLIDNDDGLLWHLLGQPSDLVPTYAAVLDRAERRIRATPGFSGDLKLAAVRGQGDGEAFAEDLSSAFLDDGSVRLNGNSLVEEFEAERFATFTLSGPDVASTAQQIAEFGPDVVLSLGSAHFVGLIVELEQLWNGLLDKPRPFTILSPIDAGRVEELQDFMGVMQRNDIDPSPHDRFVGINVAGSPDRETYVRYLSRLRSRFPMSEEEHENFYDAVYYLAYAMLAGSAEGRLDGPAVREGMLRLVGAPDAKRFGVGPSEIIDVFEALKDPKSIIALDGVTGPPDFDPKTGARVDTGSLYCFNPNLSVSFSVERFEPEAGAFEGSFDCFAGF